MLLQRLQIFYKQNFCEKIMFEKNKIQCVPRKSQTRSPIYIDGHRNLKTYCSVLLMFVKVRIGQKHRKRFITPKASVIG